MKEIKLEENQPNPEIQQSNQQSESNITPQQGETKAPLEEPDIASIPVLTVSEDERYKQYFKMLKFVIKAKIRITKKLIFFI